MTVAARVSLITIGVADVAKSTAFYQALGWPLSPSSVPGEVSFFTTDGGFLALWGRDDLARDAGATGEQAGFRGVADLREDRDAVPLGNRLTEAAGCPHAAGS
jgi:catechol 2,3-dioxygenase-like lactoylglutathione lyase family enzyme